MAELISRLQAGLSGWRPRPVAMSARAWLPWLALAMALSLAVVLWLWRDDARYKPVFGADEKVPAAEMMAALDAASIPYRIHPQTGQVLVPDGELGRVRMTLAARGVVAQLPAGLELLDKNDPLGVSQFVQDVRFRRGLEGELAQSIQTLDPVRAARVHLSLPRSTSFVGVSPEQATASVVVTLRQGQTLSREQTAAVVRLVAGSVSTLAPERVTLVDQAGNLLSARLEQEDGSGADGGEAATRFRDEALANARALLDPVLGAGNYRVSVSTEVDNDRVEETREQYGEAPKVTNEASREEKSSERAALGVPGSLSNRPIPTSASAPAAEAGGVSKNAVTRQYAYDRNITQIKRARGRLARLSVAVVLNQGAAPAGAAWTPAQVAAMDKMLRSGLGLKAERGDVLTVSAMRFPASVAALPWWQERDVVVDGASWLGSALALLLGYWLVARPALRLGRQWLERQREASPELAEIYPDPEPQLAAPAQAATQALPAPEAARPAANAVVPLLENYDLPPAGSSVDVLVDHLKGLAAKEPERVAEVVKQWVQKHGRQS